MMGAQGNITDDMQEYRVRGVCGASGRIYRRVSMV